MSTLWTPGGERPIRRDPQPDPVGPPREADASADEPGEAEMMAEMAELQERLAQTPAAVVVANHAYGLFELAALHLSLEEPQLEQARLAIDGLGLLVEGLGDRLSEHAKELESGLAQLRMAYVQIQSARASSDDPPGAAG